MKKIIFYIFVFVFVWQVSSFVSAHAQTVSSPIFPIAELGNCKDQNACKTYCDNSEHMSACIEYGATHGLINKEEAAIGKKAIEKIEKGETPGGCRDKKSCETFCENNAANLTQCIAFAEEIGIPEKEITQAKQVASALQNGATLPGGCTGKQSCETYCKNTAHIDECLSFAEKANIIPANEIAEAKKIAPFLKNGETPGKCETKDDCQNYCKEDSHFDECISFAEKANIIPKEDIEIARKTGGKGPGGCSSKDSCETFCSNPDNAKICADFAEEHDLVSKEDAENMREGSKKIKEGLEKIPPEMKSAVETCLNSIFDGKLSDVLSGSAAITKPQGEKIGICFENAAKSFADTQKNSAQSGTPPSKEQIQQMMQNVPEPMKGEIQKDIEERMKEGYETYAPKNIPNTEPSQGAPGIKPLEGPPCNSPEECRAMFGGSQPGIPQ